jgi:hypothetical protein
VGKILGRPVVLLPAGVVMLLVGLLVALNGIGAHRWGGALAEERWCESGRDELCLVRSPATIEGPSHSRREAGDEWLVRPVSGGDVGEVDLPDDASEAFADSDPGEVVALAQPDGDLVGIEADGRVVGSTWVGRYGVLQLVGLGLLGFGLGLGMVVAGWRIRRSSGSWGAHASVRQHGSGWVAIPVVAGFLVWMLPRFLY